MEDDQFFNLFAGLIWVNNLAGTTLLSLNHGTAVNLQGPAVTLRSFTVSVTDNHILTDGKLAFKISAQQGLFTDNLTSRNNENFPTSIEQPPNILI
jgi:hypothetical protein